MKSSSHRSYCCHADYDIDHEINTVVILAQEFANKQAKRAESKKDRKAILKAIATTIVDLI